MWDCPSLPVPPGPLQYGSIPLAATRQPLADSRPLQVKGPGICWGRRSQEERFKMWIVRLALRRPYTIAVMSMMILVLGILSLTRMVVDILPAIDIPVVMVVWNYPGLSPEDMERRIVLISERSYSTTVNGIERIESQCIPSIGLIKIFFQPGADLATAISQISASSNSLLRIAPPGTQAPTILPFNASNVPVAQLTLSSQNLSERTQLIRELSHWMCVNYEL